MAVKGVSVRRLGGNRAGEMRITRFLHNPKVRTDEMIGRRGSGTCAQVGGRHVLAIQDTSTLRVDEKGVGLSFHPVIAVDANAGNGSRPGRQFLSERVRAANATSAGSGRSRTRTAGAGCPARKAPALLAEAGAACVTVIEDREGDIYECFAFKPANVEKLVRAAQDRPLADGTTLFSKADAWDEAGAMAVELPAAPGRDARRAELSRQIRQGRDPSAQKPQAPLAGCPKPSP